MLTHDSLDAILDVSLVSSVIDSTHAIKKFNSLRSHLSKIRLSRNCVIESGSQVANLIGLNFMGLEVGNLSGKSKSSCLFFLSGFGVRGLL